MAMKPISSHENPRFKALRTLAGDHREPRRRGEALVDGVHLVALCLEREIAIRQLLVSESGRDKPEVATLLQSAGSDPLVLSDGLFRELTSIETPVGIAAVIAIPAESVEPIGGDAVCLDVVQDPGNVGSILRTAAAAGVHDVLLGTGCAGAWTPRVLRAGQGAHFGLRIRERVDLAAMLAECHRTTIATVVGQGSDLFDLDLRAPIVWLIGSEGTGLSPELVAAAARRATISLAATTESLNVVAATAVCLFEMARQRRVATRCGEKFLRSQ